MHRHFLPLLLFLARCVAFTEAAVKMCADGSEGLTIAAYEAGNASTATCVPEEAFKGYADDVELTGDDCKLLARIEGSAFKQMTGKLIISCALVKLAHVGSQAFSLASNPASSVTLSSALLLEDIGTQAFNRFKGTITMSGSFRALTGIGAYAFYIADNLASDISIACPSLDRPLTVGNYAFAGYKGSRDTPCIHRCEDGSEGLTIAAYEAGNASTVTCVPEEAFAYYADDVELTGDDCKLLARIEGSAFQQMSGKLIISCALVKLTHVETQAFASVHNPASSVTLSSALLLEDISNQAFNRFKGTITMSGSFRALTNIGMFAFYIADNPASSISIACPSLDRPLTVGDYAFVGYKGSRDTPCIHKCEEGSEGLTIAAYEAGNASKAKCVPEGAFAFYADDVELTGDDCKLLARIERYAFYMMSGKLIISCALEKLAHVGSQAFSGAGNPASSVTLSSALLLEDIGTLAFSYFKGTITMSGEFRALTNIGAYAFSRADNLASDISIACSSSDGPLAVGNRAFDQYAGSHNSSAEQTPCTQTPCENKVCAQGQYRVGTCTKTDGKGYTCSDCDNLQCAGAYVFRAGNCGGESTPTSNAYSCDTHEPCPQDTQYTPSDTTHRTCPPCPSGQHQPSAAHRERNCMDTTTTTTTATTTSTTATVTTATTTTTATGTTATTATATTTSMSTTTTSHTSTTTSGTRTTSSVSTTTSSQTSTTTSGTRTTTTTITTTTTYVPGSCHGKKEAVICGSRIPITDCVVADQAIQKYARDTCHVMCGLACTSTSTTSPKEKGNATVVVVVVLVVLAVLAVGCWWFFVGQHRNAGPNAVDDFGPETIEMMDNPMPAAAAARTASFGGGSSSDASGAAASPNYNGGVPPLRSAGAGAAQRAWSPSPSQSPPPALTLTSGGSTVIETGDAMHNPNGGGPSNSSGSQRQQSAVYAVIADNGGGVGDDEYEFVDVALANQSTRGESNAVYSVPHAHRNAGAGSNSDADTARYSGYAPPDMSTSPSSTASGAVHVVVGAPPAHGGAAASNIVYAVPLEDDRLVVPRVPNVMYEPAATTAYDAGVTSNANRNTTTAAAAAANGGYYDADPVPSVGNDSSSSSSRRDTVVTRQAGIIYAIPVDEGGDGPGGYAVPHDNYAIAVNSQQSGGGSGSNHEFAIPQARTAPLLPRDLDGYVIDDMSPESTGGGRGDVGGRQSEGPPAAYGSSVHGPGSIDI